MDARFQQPILGVSNTGLAGVRCNRRTGYMPLDELLPTASRHKEDWFLVKGHGGRKIGSRALEKTTPRMEKLMRDIISLIRLSGSAGITPEQIRKLTSANEASIKSAISTLTYKYPTLCEDKGRLYFIDSMCKPSELNLKERPKYNSVEERTKAKNARRRKRPLKLKPAVFATEEERKLAKNARATFMHIIEGADVLDIEDIIRKLIYDKKDEIEFALFDWLYLNLPEELRVYCEYTIQDIYSLDKELGIDSDSLSEDEDKKQPPLF